MATPAVVAAQPTSIEAASLATATAPLPTITAVPPTATHTLEPTAILTQTPTAQQAETPAAAAAAPPQATPVVNSGSPLLADRSLAKPYTSELEKWQQALGIALAVQIIIWLIALPKTRQGGRVARLVLMIFVVLLAWTKLGEWAYQLLTIVMDSGIVGKAIIVILGFLSGLQGVGNYFVYVLAYLFNDLPLLQFCVLPSVIVAFPVLWMLLQRRQQETGQETFERKFLGKR
jgi:hypothetical protein